MSRLLRRPLVAVCCVAAVFGAAQVSEACGCRRVYTNCSCVPCIATPSRSSYVPASAYPMPVAASCPTTTVQRFYLAPQTTYVTQARLEAQVGYVRRSYYDPATCCYRTSWEPATQYVERLYQVPVTRWVQQCSIETPAASPLESPASRSSSYVPTAVPERESPRTPESITRPLPLESDEIRTAPQVSPNPIPMPPREQPQSGLQGATGANPSNLGVASRARR